MLLRDLAKKINITDDVLISTLKTMKLRVKGEDQELSPAVIALLKGELEDKGLLVKEAPKKPVRKPAVKKAPVASAAKEPKLKNESKSVGVLNAGQVSAPVIPLQESPEAVTETASEIETQPSVAGIQAQDKKSVQIPRQNLPKVARLSDLENVPVVEPVPPVPVIAQDSRQFETVTEERVTFENGKKVVTKVTRKIVKNAAPQPEFVAVKPLTHGKKRSDPSSPDGARPYQPSRADVKLPDAPPPPELKRDGPLQDIEVRLPVSVGDLAFKLQQKANALLKILMGMGVFANINQNLGEELAGKLCREFGYNLVQAKTSEQQQMATHEQEKDDPSLLLPRAPVVTFMGHVDHGKTSLLDAIRKTKVADSEHGGITQHIQAYSVHIPRGTITFLDTPGHAAFTAMRSRGAHITDIVVLVVAANEGVMPQTIEAIDHARAAGVPIVVALNKVDRPDVDIDAAKKQLMQHELMPEDWGGKTVMMPVSAHTGQGIDQLLEMILLESEMLELKANPSKKAAGIVVEAHMSAGKGAMATLIVQSGTLKEGDILVVGPYYGRVKAMFDDRKRLVREAGPSRPVEVLGLSAVPEAGEKFFVVQDERTARDIAAEREDKLKAERLRSTSKVTLEDVLAKRLTGEVRDLNIILKADVQGSLEAIRDSLLKIPAENKEVAIRFIHTAVGSINSSDIILAAVSKAIIIAFNVPTSSDAEDELLKTSVEIRKYNVIYDAVNDVKSALEGLLRPELKRHFIARAEIRQVFKLSKSGTVAGCFMLKGKMKQKLDVDVIRNTEVIHTGKISALKRFKDDVREVNEGFECGISVSGFDKYQVGDLIEAFQIEQIARKL